MRSFTTSILIASMILAWPSFHPFTGDLEDPIDSHETSSVMVQDSWLAQKSNDVFEAFYMVRAHGGSSVSFGHLLWSQFINVTAGAQGIRSFEMCDHPSHWPSSWWPDSSVYVFEQGRCRHLVGIGADGSYAEIRGSGVSPEGIAFAAYQAGGTLSIDGVQYANTSGNTGQRLVFMERTTGGYELSQDLHMIDHTGSAFPSGAAVIPNPNGSHLIIAYRNVSVRLADGVTSVDLRNPSVFSPNGTYLAGLPDPAPGAEVRYDHIVGLDDGSWSIAGAWEQGPFSLGSDPPAEPSSYGYFLFRWHPDRGFEDLVTARIANETAGIRPAIIVERVGGHCLLLSPHSGVDGAQSSFFGVRLTCKEWNRSVTSVAKEGMRLHGFELAHLHGERAAFVATVDNASSIGGHSLANLSDLAIVLGVVDLTDLSVIRSSLIVGESSALAHYMLKTESGIAITGSFQENLTIERMVRMESKHAPADRQDPPPYHDAFLYHRTDGDFDWVEDVLDDCRDGHRNWTSWSANDHDGDGCHDLVEDLDDDGDGVPDGEDHCPRGLTEWTANASNDGDGDGCRDADEDSDDDQDGVSDADDQCREGQTNWTSNESSDLDGDGCEDATEDDDDDGDGIPDAQDACPRQLKPAEGEWRLQPYGCWREVRTDDGGDPPDGNGTGDESGNGTVDGIQDGNSTGNGTGDATGNGSVDETGNGTGSDGTVGTPDGNATDGSEGVDGDGDDAGQADDAPSADPPSNAEEPPDPDPRDEGAEARFDSTMLAISGAAALMLLLAITHFALRRFGE